MNRDERQERYAELASVHRALYEEREVAVRAEAENARLRAELEQEKELLWRESVAVAGLHATIERVRNAPDGDAELASQRHVMDEEWAREYTDAARLREERDTWESRYRSSVETYQDIRDENARLRAAKDKMVGSFDAMESRRNEAEQENARLRAELSSAIDNARETMGPVEMPYESQGPAMFARGWHAALDYIERGKSNE